MRHPELAVLCGITSRMRQSVGSMPAASYSRGPRNFARLAACNTLENSSRRAAAPADGKQTHARLTASDLNPFRQYFHRFGRASVFKPRTHHLTSTGIPLQRRYCALSGCTSSALSINSASHGCSLGLTLWHPYTMPHATLTLRRSGDCLRKVRRQMHQRWDILERLFISCALRWGTTRLVTARPASSSFATRGQIWKRSIM